MSLDNDVLVEYVAALSYSVLCTVKCWDMKFVYGGQYFSCKVPVLRIPDRLSFGSNMQDYTHSPTGQYLNVTI